MRLRPLTSRICAASLLVGVLAGGAAVALAEEASRFFRIGTGSTGGTYFPIGALLANAISNPPGTRPCERGGSCGVPGLIAVVQSTQGSLDNIQGLRLGNFESAFSQADISYWAYTGTGTFEKLGGFESLRAIASLYPEMVHLVVRRDSGISSIRQLEGKRISMGEPESGTRVDAEIVLSAYGIRPDEIEASYYNPAQSAEHMARGEIDAFFFVAGYPSPAIAELAETMPIDLLPIDGPEAQKIRDAYRFFGGGYIPTSVYRNVGAAPTLTVRAQWLTTAAIDDEVIYGITRALWHPTTKGLLQRGHPEGRNIRIESALAGIAIPLHPGAERYYREQGLLRDESASDEPAFPGRPVAPPDAGPAPSAPAPQPGKDTPAAPEAADEAAARRPTTGEGVPVPAGDTIRR